MTKTVIQLKKISKRYMLGDNAVNALTDVSLEIKEKEFVAITGPSGSGKSTLMNIIGLLDTPTSGTYVLNNQKVSGLSENQLAYMRNKEIGFIFQSFNLLKRSNALENVILPAIYAGKNKKEREEKAKGLMEKLGILKLINNKPNQMSGGQQQRVAIARALMNDPAIILADEPTGNLDSKSGQDLMDIFKELNKEGRTIILITHEPDIAKQTKRTIHVKDGRIAK